MLPGVESVAALLPGPTTIATRKQEHRLLLEGLRRLPVEQQVLLELRYIEGIPPKELAEVVDIPPSTMRGRVDSARKALREIISKLESSAALIASSLESLDRWADEVREGQSRDRHDDDFPE